MLRVCLVSAAYHPYPSGVSEHVSQLAGSLRDIGHEVEVLTTRFPGYPEPAAESFPVTRLGRALMVPMNRSYATLPVGFGLARDVKRFFADRRFDIVHCHGMFWPDISYWALRYSRSVNLASFLAAGFRINRRGGRVCGRLFRGLYRRVDGLVPISERARAAFIAYVPGLCAPAGGLDWRIIPSGVDLERFRPGLPPLPARAGPGDPPTILFLGRLDARKGIGVLLRAMPVVLRELPAARLVVVGTGPEAGRARRLTAKLGLESAVCFVGRVGREELPRYYRGSDVYCAPTLGGETLGIVLLEAMAAGVPVVASDIPGYDETVRRDRDGLLVPPGRPDVLATALLRALHDTALRRRLAGAGSARVQEYAWPVIARRTDEYYRELRERAGTEPGRRARGRAR